jgi:hypothetical protein
LARFLLALLAILALAVALRSALAPERLSDGPEGSAGARAETPVEPAPASPVRDWGFGEPTDGLRQAPEAVIVRVRGDRAGARFLEGMELFAQGDYYGALVPLSEAHESSPNEPHFCFALARVYHVLNLTREAVALLRCLYAAPPAEFGALRGLVEQLERSAEFEMEFDAAASDHFVASYPREGAAAERIGEVLDMLERARDHVGRLSGIEAARQIPVVVYEAVDFGEAAGAPDWARGAFDGKIRISIEFLEEDPLQFANALRHEYMHAALRERTGARVPAWMQEGLANLVTERRYPADALRQRLRASGDFLTIEMLSRSFGSLGSEAAPLAYLQSYWMTRGLVDRHGFEAVEALIADLDADPLREFDDSFRARFGDWPEVYLERWYEDFLAE